MKKTNFHGHPDYLALTEDELKLHSAKNQDYAKGGDPLGNFKRVASILSNYPGLDPSNPVVVDIVYALKQLDAALWMLCQGYEGEVEDIDSRLRDVHIYIKIARILHKKQRRIIDLDKGCPNCGCNDAAFVKGNLWECAYCLKCGWEEGSLG